MQAGLNNKQKISIRSLQIFECVARTGSTIKAAEELSVTQSAISHQIKQLSQALGEALLEKSGRSLKLTERGAELAQELTKAFSNIGESVNTIIGTNRNRVRLAVCSSFGTGWLAQRMPHFLEHHPDISFDIQKYGDDPDLSDTVADAFITAKPVISGFQSIDLVEERLIAVAAPAYGQRYRGKQPPCLISTTVGEPMRGTDWLNFLSLSDSEQVVWQRSRALYCSHYVTALSFAETECGVALIPDFLAERALRDGRLMRFLDGSIKTGRTYRFCVKSSRIREPALAAVLAWFTGPVAQSHVKAAE
ncbi:MAG: LysR family transcriptional regulator [Rhizobiales bacterium]|nr:LysR family transcriptional regulator [Hyphomicrobiales bacterium]